MKYEYDSFRTCKRGIGTHFGGNLCLVDRRHYGECYSVFDFLVCPVLYECAVRFYVVWCLGVEGGGCLYYFFRFFFLINSCFIYKRTFTKAFFMFCFVIFHFIIIFLYICFVDITSTILYDSQKIMFAYRIHL